MAPPQLIAFSFHLPICFLYRCARVILPIFSCHHICRVITANNQIHIFSYIQNENAIVICCCLHNVCMDIFFSLSLEEGSNQMKKDDEKEREERRVVLIYHQVAKECLHGAFTCDLSLLLLFSIDVNALCLSVIVLHTQCCNMQYTLYRLRGAKWIYCV